VAISKEQLFAEMERIWNQIGHRPSRTEWESSNPLFSYGLYRHRFNGWSNACLEFIEYKMGKPIVLDSEQLSNSQGSKRATQIRGSYRHRTPLVRDVPPSLKVKVLNRDRFRCVYCGRSPAKDIAVELHIDHIKPFSKGGKTTMENLQTLCQDCNLGKGDRQSLG